MRQLLLRILRNSEKIPRRGNRSFWLYPRHVTSFTKVLIDMSGWIRYVVEICVARQISRQLQVVHGQPGNNPIKTQLLSALHRSPRHSYRWLEVRRLSSLVEDPQNSYCVAFCRATMRLLYFQQRSFLNIIPIDCVDCSLCNITDVTIIHTDSLKLTQRQVHKTLFRRGHPDRCS